MQKAGEAASLFFMGKLYGRNPDYDMVAAAKPYLTTLDEARIRTLLTECGTELSQRGEASKPQAAGGPCPHTAFGKLGGLSGFARRQGPSSPPPDLHPVVADRHGAGIADRRHLQRQQLVERRGIVARHLAEHPAGHRACGR